ncbi:hypothetical protein ACOAKG_29225 [Streptomyces sp. JL3001]|uniref:hypothetical protein n=1 Tax=Streptomyces sp. JL3001 TaxID=3400923 RepID=UPI003B28A3CA
MSSWRQRILDGHRGDVDAWLEAEDTTGRTEDEVDSEQRANWLSSVREWDPESALPEELVIRLFGGEAGSGGLRFAVGNALLKPLQDGVTASSDEDVELELVGVSAGSTVLHVRPVAEGQVPTGSSASGGEEAEESRATSRVMNSLLDAVGTLEAEADVSEWTPMLSSLSRVVSALDKFDLSMQLRWLDGQGGVRSTSLTETGRGYLRELRKSHGEAFAPVRRSISGLVTELKLSGAAVIKPAASPAVTVKFEPGEISSVGWRLGEYVNLVVEERRRITRRGARPVIDFVYVEPEEFTQVEALDDLEITLRDADDGEQGEQNRASNG